MGEKENTPKKKRIKRKTKTKEKKIKNKRPMKEGEKKCGKWAENFGRKKIHRTKQKQYDQNTT